MLFWMEKTASGIWRGELAIKFPDNCPQVSDLYFASGCSGEQTQAMGALHSFLKDRGDILCSSFMPSAAWIWLFSIRLKSDGKGTRWILGRSRGNSPESF